MNLNTGDLTIYSLRKFGDSIRSKRLKDVCKQSNFDTSSCLKVSFSPYIKVGRFGFDKNEA